MKQRWLVTITGALFIMTKAWMTLIAEGQLYIFYPFLCILLLFLFEWESSLIVSFLIGLVAIILILSRPTALLILFPLLFLVNRYSLNQILVFFIPIITLLTYSFLNKNERSFWIDYRKAIAVHIRFHQSDTPTPNNKLYTPVHYKEWEGLNQKAIDTSNAQHPVHIHMENAGIQEIVKKIFHKKIHYTILGYCNIFIIVLLSAIFFLKQKNNPSPVGIVLIFGFCLYMISDFFSPIIRLQYYTVQWIFPLLVCAALYNANLWKVNLLLIIGLLLNVISQPYYLMRHTIGEYLILFTLLWLCLSRQSKFLK